MTTTLPSSAEIDARYSDHAAKWRAVLAKDAQADGAFWFSVRTTRVYCKPSCSSRRPRRENVGFHESPAAAEQAGFHACKRCRPSGPTLAQEHARAVTRACRAIDAATDALTLAELAKIAGMSASHFHRAFKAMTGVTPKQYAVARRSERLRDTLRQESSVTHAIHAAGFGSSGRFYAKSAETLGMQATDFRAGGNGSAIRFAIGVCSLGFILVAATERGVCAILIGDDQDALTRDLQDRFPRATLITGDAEFQETVARVVSLIEAPHSGFDLPLDLRGTVFQMRVWRALQGIPVGTTASYTEIAARIGLPKAVRAVAGACGANALAVAIPCHRVVRTDGGISGYRWGVARKRELLAREKAGPGPTITNTET